MHGSEKRRTWRKSHMAVDVDSHEIISAEMTLVNVGDSEVLPTLLNPLRRKISEVSADSAYDTKLCNKALKDKKMKPLILSGKIQDVGKRGIQEMELSKH